MNTEQDTGKFRTNDKDQFYTKIDVAKKCVAHIIENCFDAKDYVWIEPSVGGGAFLTSVPQEFIKIGIDLDPKIESTPNYSIIKSDYMMYEYDKSNIKSLHPNKKVIVFGNPPFGKQGSLAKKFIKHSLFADIIAFILPKSFVKPRQCVFNMFYHKVFEADVEKDAFEVNGASYDVPCVFQIWKKENHEREKVAKIPAIGFKYVKKSNPYHIAIRRVGVYAGKCYVVNAALSSSSHYFIYIDEKNVNNVGEIMDKVNNYVFPSNTVGPRSLSKSEINYVLNTMMK